MSMDESLRPHACTIAQRLRRAGRRVDLVLEDKKMKWAFKVGGSMRPWLLGKACCRANCNVQV